MSQFKDTKKKMKQEVRRPYQTSRLVIYGALRDQTASGSGLTQENNPGSGPKSKRP